MSVDRPLASAYNEIIKQGLDMEVQYTVIAKVDGVQVAKLNTGSEETAYDLVRIASRQVDKKIAELYTENKRLANVPF